MQTRHEKFEDIKGITRYHTSRKDRDYNGQKKTDRPLHTKLKIPGKVFEYCKLSKLKLDNIFECQFGFTEGMNPLISSYILYTSIMYILR